MPEDKPVAPVLTQILKGRDEEGEFKLSASPAIPEPTGPNALYCLRAPMALGLDKEDGLVYGMQLVCVYEGEDDPLKEQLDALGYGVLETIHLPDSHLQPGKVYEARVCNIQRDPETGIIDQWDVQLVEFIGDVPTDPTLQSIAGE